MILCGLSRSGGRHGSLTRNRAHGFRLGVVPASRARPGSHRREAQRDHRHPAAGRTPQIEGRVGHHRRYGLSDQDRRHLASHKVDWLAEDSRFPGIKSIAIVENTVERNGETTCERRYDICSVILLAALFADAVRCHWHIEKRLHWVLDVVFREDLSRLRTGHGPHDMATGTPHGHEPAAIRQAGQEP